MLELRKIYSPADRSEFLQSFDPTKQSWIVSDLKSKFEIQSLLMTKYGFFEDQSVQRASDLWVTLLKRCDPDMRVVSNDFIKAWLRDQLDELGDNGVESSQGLEKLLVQFMENFAQAITHPNGQELITDWLEQNPSSQQCWGYWFNQASEYGAQILAGKKLGRRWIAAYLTNFADSLAHWNRNLIVDLGMELTRAEADIFREIAKTNDVLILEPCLQQEGRYSFLKKPYEQLRDPKSLFSKQFPKPSEPQILKLTSPLAEVKHCTYQTRQWLQAGIQPHEIAIIAPDIESYWGWLDLFFSHEGLPISKDSIAKLHSFPAIQFWLSRLKMSQNNFDYADLQLSIFDKAEPTPFRFERFEALFKNILDAQDLARDPIVLREFGSTVLPSGKVSREVFIGFALKFWPLEGDTNLLEMILRDILQVASEGTQLHLRNWIFWLSQVANRLEVRLRSGDRQGVQCLNLLGSDSPNYRKRVFLGLTESNFRKSKIALISPSEVERIFQDTGFHCDHPEQSPLNFELSWLCLAKNVEDQFLFPMNSMEGAVEAPHPLWLELSRDRDLKPEAPEPTVIDGATGFTSLGARLGWNSAHTETFKEQIAIDLGTPSANYIGAVENEKFSASQLENFYACPFKFAAAKIFKLLDESEMDLEPDARVRGRVVHKLFEELARPPRRSDWQESEIAALLEQIFSQEKIGDKNFWPPLKQKWQRLAFRFLQFEAKDPHFIGQDTIAVEKKFEVEIAGNIWSGVIDRIDRKKDGGLTLYDYKASHRKYAPNQWLKHNHLQLGFYAWLVQNKLLTEFLTEDLQGAFYYVYRDFEMLGATKGDDKYKIVQDNLSAIELKIKGFSEAMQKGEFPARPADETTCEYCKWSKLCRAQHLMQ